MSALPIAPHTPARRPLGGVDDRPALRVLASVGAAPERRRPVRPVGAERPAGPRTQLGAHPLAPRSRAQAWRRRLTALLVVASVLALLVVAVLARVTPVVAPVPVASTTVVVQPGDTLWGIATAHRPEGVATAAYVEDVIEVNGLDGASVDAWQVLVLPGA